MAYGSSEIYNWTQGNAVREAVRQVEARQAAGRANRSRLMPMASAQGARPSGYYDEDGNWQDYEQMGDEIEANPLAP